MKICKNCSRAMDDNYNVCPYCGVPFDVAPKQDFSSAEQQNAQQQYNNVPPYYQNAPVNDKRPEKSEAPEYILAPRPQRSAYIAAFLAVFLGMFGVHNFYLDRKNKALTQLLITVIGTALTFGIAAIAMEVWAVVDAVKLLKGEINVDGTGEMIKMGF